MDKNEEIKYESSGIFLEMAKDEYTKESERANSLDSKSSFFITVIVAVATIFVPIIPFNKLLIFFTTYNGEREGFAILFILILTVSFILLGTAFYTLYKAYKLTEFFHPNLESIDQQENHLAEQGIVNKALCDHYKQIVEHNRDINDNKCVCISAGIKLCGIGFLLLIVATIGLLIIV